MRFEEWPSLGRVNGWGPTWHGTCLRSHHRAGQCSPPDSPSCFSFIACTLAAAPGVGVGGRGTRAGWHSASHPGWTCQRSAKESLEGLVSVGSTPDAQAHPLASSRQPLSLSHPEALREVGWTRVWAPSLRCKESHPSHLLYEVEEPTQVKCLQRCLAPRKSWVQVPGYPLASIISQIAT